MEAEHIPLGERTVNGIPYVEVNDPSQNILKDVQRSGILEVVPHSRQEDFLQIPDTVYEALYGGAAYGGKSFLLTLFPLIRGFYKYRGFKGLLLRRELTDLEKEVIRLSKEYFPLTGAKYNETKHTWYWPEYGSYFDFSHIQHLKDVKAYDTAQYNYAAFDELTHFEEPMYRYFVGSRVRPGSSFNIAIVRNGTNPGGIGQTFVYNRFVRPNEKGYTLIRDKVTGLKRMFIPALAQDNPYGMKYDPQYLMKLEILPEAEKRAKKYGDWHAFEGSVFVSFRPLKFPDEPDNALHVCKYFDIPEWWPRIVTVDWGKRAMCHALWAAISPDNRLYIYRERVWKGVDVPFWATEVGQCSEFENIVLFVLCGSAWQERGTETIKQQVQRYSGMIPTSSQNSPGSRVSSLQTVQDFLRWEQKPQRKVDEFYDHGKAKEIYERLGEDGLKRYMDYFKEQKEETNIPILQILSSPSGGDDTIAPVLVETIPACVYDDKKKEDIAEFDGDDPIDNLRYLCKYVRKFMDGTVGEELERRKKIQDVIDRYKSTGDTTAYYRNMERIETEDKDAGFGVKRATSRRRH
jgi:hypothetical protein